MMFSTSSEDPSRRRRQPSRAHPNICGRFHFDDGNPRSVSTLSAPSARQSACGLRWTAHWPMAYGGSP
eukprot:528154-Prymnesium_polylepis.1